MPIYAKPAMRAKIWLDVDEHDEPRPVFYSRALTLEQQIELSDAIDALHQDLEGITNREFFERGLRLLGESIDSWEHMPEGFELRLLSYSEIRELLRKVAYAQSLTFAEKKD